MFSPIAQEVRTILNKARHQKAGIHIIIRDTEFHGPAVLGSTVPSHAGIYLVCTESSGGIRILGVYESKDMSSYMTENTWSQKWKEFEDNNGLFVYWSGEIPDEKDRAAKVWDIIYTRPYDIPCVSRPKDDW